jgi:hypothetical protein
MKSLLVAVFSFVTLLSIASAGEGPQSVLQQPTPAAEPAVVAAPAVVAVAAGDCCNSCDCASSRVVGGRSRTRYRVVTEGCDACTGRSVRSVSRGVVRGTGAVVQGVGAAAYNVITLPVRACRAGCRSGSCCN